jgi:hypothetical protein
VHNKELLAGISRNAKALLSDFRQRFCPSLPLSLDISFPAGGAQGTGPDDRISDVWPKIG